MRIVKYLIYLFFVVHYSVLPGISQSNNCIDLNEIPQKKVRKYIHSRDIDTMNDFSSIHASCKKEIKESDFKISEKIFYLKSKLSNVWDSYKNENPSKSFNGHKFRLELLIQKGSNNIVYKNNPSFPVIDTGQLYFFDIRLIRGLFNIPMAFEIINIDNSQKILEVSYIESNKAKGKQRIQFIDNGDGRTMVVHQSFFKSNSWIRDTFLYPYFHKKIVREYHRNMKEMVQNQKKSLITLNYTGSE